jgi:DNA repair exonuclease SbcCD nuclease subunit
MKILSTGDLHIGTECDPDVKAACSEICSIAKKEQPNLIVLTGDIYDSTSSPTSRQTAVEIVKEYASISDVVIIKGNHDASKDLLIFNDIRGKYPISVYERPVIHYGPPGRDRLSIHFLPWFTKAAWVAAKIGEDFNIETSTEAVSVLATAYLRAQIAEAKNLGCVRHFLFGHMTIAGAKAENHQPLLGEGITLGYHDLKASGFNAGAFGHIHLGQEFGKEDEPKFIYNGAPAALNYGESCKDKRFSILDTDTMEFTFYPLKSVQRITFDAIWSGSLFPVNVPFELEAGVFDGARVKVKLLIEEGFNPEDGEKAVQEFIENYGKTLEVKIERATKPKEGVRSEEIAKAKTAVEKLEAYWKATDTTPEEPMRSDMLRLVAEIEAECILKTGELK